MNQPKAARQKLYESLVKDNFITQEKWSPELFDETLGANLGFRDAIKKHLARQNFDVAGFNEAFGITSETTPKEPMGLTQAGIDAQQGMINRPAASPPPVYQPGQGLNDGFSEKPAMEPRRSPIYEPGQGLAPATAFSPAPSSVMTTDALEARKIIEDRYMQRQMQPQRQPLGGTAAETQFRAMMSMAPGTPAPGSPAAIPAVPAAPKPYQVPQVSMVPNPSSTEGMIQVVDVQSGFKEGWISKAQVDQTLDSIARDYVGKPYSALAPVEQNVVMQKLTDRYLPVELANEMMAKAGYERDMGAFENAYNSFVRSAGSVFIDANTAFERIQNPGEGETRRYLAAPDDRLIGQVMERQGVSDASISAKRLEQQEALNNAFKVDPARLDNFWGTTIPSALGGSSAIMAVSAAGAMLGGPVGGAVAAGTIGASSGYEQGFQVAKELGASDDDAKRVATSFGVLGASEAIPMVSFLKKIRGSQVLSEGVKQQVAKRFLGGMLTQAAEEVPQELMVYVGQKLAVNEVLDLSQEIFDEEFVETAVIAGTIGAGTGAFGGAINMVRSAQAKALTPEDQQRAADILNQMSAAAVAPIQSKIDQELAEARKVSEAISAQIEQIRAMPAPSQKLLQEAMEDLEDVNSFTQELENAGSLLSRNSSPENLAYLTDRVGWLASQSFDMTERLTQSQRERDTEISATRMTQAAKAEAEAAKAPEAEPAAQSPAPQGEATPAPAPETVAPDPPEEWRANMPAQDSFSKASPEEAGLVERATRDGEDSNYKPPKEAPDRNKVRRVFAEDGSVEFGIKQTASGTMLYTKGEDGTWMAKNLRTGTQKPLGASSSIAKALTRPRPQSSPEAAPAQPQETPGGQTDGAPPQQVTEEIPVAPDAAPVAPSETAVAPQPSQPAPPKAAVGGDATQAQPAPGLTDPVRVEPPVPAPAAPSPAPAPASATPTAPAAPAQPPAPAPQRQGEERPKGRTLYADAPQGKIFTKTGDKDRGGSYEIVETSTGKGLLYPTSDATRRGQLYSSVTFDGIRRVADIKGIGDIPVDARVEPGEVEFRDGAWEVTKPMTISWDDTDVRRSSRGPRRGPTDTREGADANTEGGQQPDPDTRSEAQPETAPQDGDQNQDEDDESTISGYMYSRKRPTKGKMEPALPDDVNAEVKTPRKIIGDLRRGIKIDIGWRRLPGAFGFYNPKTDKVGITYQGDLITTAHEIGHVLDSRYTIVNSTSRPPGVAAELAQWGQMSPQAKGSNPASAQVLQQEGFAHFMEAWVLNPKETAKISPALAQIMETELSAADKSVMDDFSNAVRNYLTTDVLSASANNVAAALSDKDASDKSKSSGGGRKAVSGWKNSPQEIREMAGEFAKFLGPIASMKRMWLDGMASTFGSWETAMKTMGLVPDAKDGVRYGDGRYQGVHLQWTMAKLLGRHGRFGQFIKTGIVMPSGKVFSDSQGRVVTLKYLMEAYDQTSLASLSKELDMAMGLATAQRSVEIVGRSIQANEKLMEKLQAVGVTPDDLDRSVSDPLTFARYVMAKVTQYNMMNRDTPINLDTIISTGAGQYGVSDFQRALNQLEAFERMQNGTEADKASAARVDEGLFRYREASRAILEYARGQGRISQEEYDTIVANNQYYSAMQRVFELTADADDTVMGNKGGFGLTRVNAPFSKAKGSAREIVSPMQALFENVSKVIHEADRNKFLAEFVSPFEQIQRSARFPMDSRKSAATVVEDVSAEIEDRNGQTTFRGKMVNAKDAKFDGRLLQEVFIDGQQRWFLIAEPIAMELERMYMVGKGGMVQEAIRMMTTIWKKFITMAPTWLVRSVPRDVVHRAIVTPTGGTGLRGYASIFDKKAWERLRAAGGSQAGLQLNILASYEDHMAFVMKGLVSDGDVNWGAFKPPSSKAGRWLSSRGGVGYGMHRAYKHWEEIMQGAEEISRIAEFESRVKQLMDMGLPEGDATMAAAYSARDLIDYARGGMMAMEVNKIVPFFNPALRGVDKFMRTAADAASNRERGLLLATRFMSYIAMPSIGIALASYLSGDEEERKDWVNQYVNKPDYERYLFWNVKVGPDSWLKIAKPFEFGAIGTAMEAMVMRGVTGDKRFTDGMFHQTMKAFVPFSADDIGASIGGPLNLMYELPANYDMFRGRSIVPPAQEGKDVNLTTIQNATQKASALGRGFQYVAKEFIDADVDARKVDYSIRKVFGTFGGYAVDLAKPNMGVRGNPDPGAEVLRRLTLLQYNPTFVSKDWQDFMEFAQATNAGTVNGPHKDLLDGAQLLLDYYDAAETMKQREAISSQFLAYIKSAAELARDPEYRKKFVQDQNVKKALREIEKEVR